MFNFNSQFEEVFMTGRKLTKKSDDTRPPQNPTVGQRWYDQMLGCVRKWDGKAWVETKPGDLAKERGQ